MTVGEIMTKIRELDGTISALHKIKDTYEMKNGESITIDDAIDAIDDYICELKQKHVK